METSSPTGHEEIEEHVSKEAKGNEEVPLERERRRNPPVHNVEVPTSRNPKHTGRRPRTDNE